MANLLWESANRANQQINKSAGQQIGKQVGKAADEQKQRISGCPLLVADSLLRGLGRLIS
jgi:hypothetical protein